MDKFGKLKDKLIKSYYRETFDFMKARLANSNVYTYDERGEERKRILREALKSYGYNVAATNEGRRSGWITHLELCGLKMQMFCKCDNADAYIGLTLYGHSYLYISIDRNLPTRLEKLTKAQLIKMLEIPANGGSEAGTEWFYMPYLHRRKVTSLCLKEDSDNPLF
jgi:hypothetical protein